MKNVTAQAVYHRKQHHKYKQEAIMLKEEDLKDMTTMFESLVKDKDFTS